MANKSVRSRTLAEKSLRISLPVVVYVIGRNDRQCTKTDDVIWNNYVFYIMLYGYIQDSIHWWNPY